MHRFLVALTLPAMLFWGMPTERVAAQQKQEAAGPPRPILLGVLPAGAKVGTSVEVTLTGRNLDDVEGLVFSNPAIKADRIAGPAPDLAAMKNRTGTGGQMRDGRAAADSVVRFKVTVPANAKLGHLDVRVLDKTGHSNPRTFVIGDLNEELEKEPNSDVAEAQKIALNTTINGVISTPTDVDYFHLSGKAGQRIVAACLTSSIDSRLQADLQLFDATGKRLAGNRGYAFDDAVLDATFPADGDYYLRLAQFTYTQGGPDYFYRLSVGTFPWIDAVFPPMIEPGKPSTVTIHGRNLPGGKDTMTVTVTPPTDRNARTQLAFTGLIPPGSAGVDGFGFRLSNKAGSSNEVLIGYAAAPVVVESGDNDTPETAQSVPVPCEIAGRLEKLGDLDWFAFPARKGEPLSIELLADRIGTPADTFLTLRGPTGQALGEYDENLEILHPRQFYTRTDDPARIRFVPREDGMHKILVSSREVGVLAGPRQIYRLRITPEMPDFRLVMMPIGDGVPDATVVTAGGGAAFAVYAFRQDGFEGPIELRAEGLPPGVSCAKQVLAAEQRQGVMVVTAAADAKPWAGTLQVIGTAKTPNGVLERVARPAGITWPIPAQGNIPAIARLERELVLAVRGEAPFQVTTTIEKVSVMPGEKASIPLTVKRGKDIKGPIQIAALGLPTSAQGGGRGNTPAGVSVAADKGTLALDIRPDTRPGLYTLVLRGTTVIPLPSEKDDKGKPKGNPRPTTLTEFSVPIVLSVLSKTLATVAVTPAELDAKAGTSVAVTVKVERQGEFDGPLKVEVVGVEGTRDVSAEPVTLKPGQNTATVNVNVGAKATGRLRLEVRVSGSPDGKKSALIAEKLRINVR